MRLKQP
jgi:hypothetical protein